MYKHYKTIILITMYKHYKTIRIQQLLISTATAVTSLATNRSISTLASSSDEHSHTSERRPWGSKTPVYVTLQQQCKKKQMSRVTMLK